MSDLRRAVRLAVAALGLALPAAAVEMDVPRVERAAEPAPAALSEAPSMGVPGITPFMGDGPSLALPPVARVVAPALARPVPAAASAVPAGPVAVSDAMPSASPPHFAGAPAGDSARDTPALEDLRRLAAQAPGPAPVLNDEGVFIMGKAADTYREIRRLMGVLTPRVNLAESLDVMDATVADIRAKLLSIEAIAKDRKIGAVNTRLDNTLTWVDAVLEDGDRRVAVQTVQVYFHPAPAGPLKAASEIAEGNRRVDAYLDAVATNFKQDGSSGTAKIDEIVLAFDARGYKEIKDHLRRKEAEFKAKLGGRVRFAYVDELLPPAGSTERIRADYNRLVEKYKGDAQGLRKIMDGVMYSRYVGLLLELKTLEHFDRLRYTVLQSGRDLFGPDGRYITELDAVVRSPEGKVLLVEAKSARVGLPVEAVMKDKVLSKLDAYKKNRALLEKTMGGPLNVVFSFDVGGQDSRAAAKGELVWRNPQQKKLMEHLKAQAPVLSREYGFPVSFLFIDSRPGEDPMLFYRTPAAPNRGSGRKHGRRR